MAAHADEAQRVLSPYLRDTYMSIVAGTDRANVTAVWPLAPGRVVQTFPPGGETPTQYMTRAGLGSKGPQRQRNLAAIRDAILVVGTVRLGNVDAPRFGYSTAASSVDADKLAHFVAFSRTELSSYCDLAMVAGIDMRTVASTDAELFGRDPVTGLPACDPRIFIVQWLATKTAAAGSAAPAVAAAAVAAVVPPAAQQQQPTALERAFDVLDTVLPGQRQGLSQELEKGYAPLLERLTLQPLTSKETEGPAYFPTTFTCNHQRLLTLLDTRPAAPWETRPLVELFAIATNMPAWSMQGAAGWALAHRDVYEGTARAQFAATYADTAAAEQHEMEFRMDWRWLPEQLHIIRQSTTLYEQARYLLTFLATTAKLGRVTDRVLPAGGPVLTCALTSRVIKPGECVLVLQAVQRARTEEESLQVDRPQRQMVCVIGAVCPTAFPSAPQAQAPATQKAAQPELEVPMKTKRGAAKRAAPAAAEQAPAKKARLAAPAAQAPAAAVQQGVRVEGVDEWSLLVDSPVYEALRDAAAACSDKVKAEARVVIADLTVAAQFNAHTMGGVGLGVVANRAVFKTLRRLVHTLIGAAPPPSAAAAADEDEDDPEMAAFRAAFGRSAAPAPQEAALPLATVTLINAFRDYAAAVGQVQDPLQVDETAGACFAALFI